ncbi:porin family protein [Limibacter armeniacum]|uniref:type IX secretion/gliding motility protein PorT/SprT n=1 Tax=Limibacter armeniacum TaxID=466084 RepID=UPI002FE5DA47
MRSTNIWHQFHLHGKKIIGIAVIILMGMMTTSAHAQKSKTYNLIKFDKRKLHYGFQLGLFRSSMKLTYSDFFLNDPDQTFVNVQVVPKGGFSIGFILNVALPNEYLDFRFTPNVSFYERAILFEPTTNPNPGQELPPMATLSTETTVVELPFLLKYKSQRRRNHRVYLVGGLIGGIQVGNKPAETDPDKQFHLQDINVEVAVGLGMDLYMQMFNFAPELRFSHNVLSVYDPSDNIYAKNIEKLVPYKLALIFNFEG